VKQGYFEFWEVTAGFPSPAESGREPVLSLDDLLLPHPDASFFVRVRGHSMRDAGIQEHDLLVVDRAVEATHGQIIVAQLNKGFLIKRLLIDGETLYLASAHPRYPTFPVRPHMQFSVWGVVLFIIHPAHPLAIRRLLPKMQRPTEQESP
jgi:DNA polymerase V